MTCNRGIAGGVKVNVNMVVVRHIRGTVQVEQFGDVGKVQLRWSVFEMEG